MNIGTVEPDVGVILDHTSHEDYTRDNGLLVLPLAAASGAPKVITVHAPINYRVVKVNEEKLGAPPLFQSFNDPANGRDKFLGASLTFLQPTLSNDQKSQKFAMRGEYHYVETAAVPRGTNPTDLTDLFHTGRYPFNLPLKDEVLATAVRAGLFNGFGEPINPSLYSPPLDAAILRTWPSPHVPSFFMIDDLVR